MTAVRTVLVSGASIAGPALAHWLHRYDIRATVVEKAPAPRMGGHAIDVRGAAVDVAERMGVLDSLRASVTETGRVVFVDTRGRPYADIASTMGSGDDRSLEVVRGDLTRILHEPTVEHTEYLYDDSITALEETPEGVRVSFRRSEPRLFDLVVGADGLHSETRRLTMGPEDDHARYMGALICIGGVPDRLGLGREARLYNEPGRAAGMIRSPRFDGAKGIALLHAPDLNGIDRAPEADQKAFLLERFAGAGWECDRLLEDLTHSPDFYFDSIKQIHLDRWHRGRVVLLGDAAHCPSPMSGQGTTLAMVGAYVLALELSRHERLVSALHAYETRMRPYVKANQEIADTGIGFLAPRTRLGLTARNTLLRFGGLLTRLSGLDRRVVETAEAIDLDARPPADMAEGSDEGR
ncbi:FAD-dependent monooxygenase [Nocardiopsis alba]|uniref:FAD-dependent monooxygenase n=1 Tax=Nocardiopsis alba TaxID=53437 RepID=UPI0033E13812